MIKNKHISKKILLIIALLGVITAGYFSLAYFFPGITIGSLFNTGGTSIASSGADITWLNPSNSVTVENKYPMTEEVAMNVVTPYTLQIRNNSTTDGAIVNIYLESKNGNTITNDGLISAKVGDADEVKLTNGSASTNSGYNNSYLIYAGIIAANTTVNLDLRIWINELGNNIEGNANNVENKSWSGKIVVNGTSAGNPITITFNAGDGTVSPSTKTVYYKTYYGELPTPTRSLPYEFAGWYLDSSYTTEVTKDSIVNQKINHTIYAKWNELSLFCSTANSIIKLLDIKGNVTNCLKTSNIPVGTEIAIGEGTNQQNFYVISSTSDTVTALAKYNLVRTSSTSISADALQATSATAYNYVRFDDNSTTYAGSEMETYMNNYATKLNTIYSIPSNALITARAIEINELENFGCTSSSGSCTSNYAWLYGYYWSGSANYTNYNLWCVRDSQLDYIYYSRDTYCGARPVITISKSLF